MNTKLRYLAVFVAFTLVFVWCVPSFGQVIKGSISGSVIDPQGAVVSGAQVKAKNVETGVVFSTTTDSSGLFRLNLLPVGTYTVEVSNAGFKTATHSNVAVAAGSDVGVGAIKMAIGEASTTVEVSATAPLIETTQAQVTNTFSGTTLNTFAGIQENEGLDQLASFVPGISQSRSNNFSNSNGGGGFSSNGLRGRNNDQQIDGQNNNDNSVGGPALFVSSPEFVQQYVLITNNFGPEYGRNAGSVVNVITKSGSNAWHGSVFGNDNNSYVNALSNTQRRFTQIPPDFHFLTGPLRSNEEYSGGTIGGPVIKNKVFLFGGLDTDLFSGDNLFITSSQTPTPAGLATLLGCYPNSATVAALAKFGPFGISGGNPAATPSSTTKTFTLRNITAPLNSGISNCNGVEFGGVMRAVPAPFHGFDWIVRNDIQLGSDSISTRYLFNRNNTFAGASSGTAAAAAGYPNNVPALSQAMLVSWTRNLSARMVNEARVGFGRINVEFGGNSIGNTVPGANQLDQALANVTFNRTFLTFGPATNIPQQRIVNTWQAQDNWNFVMGKHALKAGVNWTYQRSPNIFLPSLNGAYRFNDFNFFVADWPNRVQVAEGPSSFDFREYDTFGYFGDDWKFSQNLTLNLGVTYSYYGQPANLFHDITAPRESNPATAFWNPASAPANVFPAISAPKNSWGPSVGFAYSPQWGGFLTGNGKTTIRGGYRLLYDPPFYNIYSNIATSAPIVFLQSFTIPTSSATQPGILPPPAAFDLPAVPTGPNVRALLQSQLTPGVFDPRSQSETTIPTDFRPDRVHSWSFGIERQVSKNSALEVRYAGNRGTDLFQSVDANPFLGIPTSHPGLAQDFPNLVPAGLTPCAVGTVVPGPGQTDASPALGAGRENCAAGVLRSRTNTGRSDYHSVQTEFRANNLFKQLTVRTGYTFSKNTDNVSEIFSTFTAGNSNAFAQNPLDINKGEHGISGLNFTHRWTMLFNEDLPFFKSQHGFIGHVLGGWNLSATYILASGQPYTPSQQVEAQITDGAHDYYDSSFLGAFNSGVETARPFLGSASAPVTSIGIYCGDAHSIFGVNCGTIPNTQLVSLTALNQSCLSLTASSTTPCNFVTVTNNDVRFIENTKIAQTVFNTPFGNVGRNTLTDAIQNIANFSVGKNFKIGESYNFEMRATAINALNHFNFTSIDPFIFDAGLIGNGTGFGDPSVTTSNGRRLWVGGRFTF